MSTTGYERTGGDLDEKVKKNYSPTILDIFQADDNKMMKWFKRGSAGALRGELLHIPMRLRRNPTGGPGGEFDAYPAPKTSTLTHVEVTPTYYRNSGEVTHRAKDDTAEAKLAFVDQLDDAMNECPEGIKRQMNRDLYAGRWSMRARLQSVANVGPGGVGNVWTLYDAAYHATPYYIDKWGTRALLEDQEVEVYNATGTTRRTDVATTQTYWTILSRDTTAQVTIAETGLGPNGIADGDIIVVRGALAWGAGTPTANQPVGKGIFGLAEIYNKTGSVMCPARLFATFGINFDRTTLAKLDSVQKDMTGVVAMAGNDLEDLCDAVRVKCGRSVDSGPSSLWIAHKSIKNLIKHWHDTDTRFAPQQAKFGVPDGNLFYVHGSDPGFQIEYDDLAIPDTLFVVNRDFWNYYENAPIQFDDTEGKIFHLKRSANVTTGDISTYQILQFFQFWRGQFFCPLPNTGGVMFGINGADSEYGQGVGFVPDL